MKAFVVESYGADGLRAADVPRPRVGPTDVLVEVRAAGVNPLDRMVRDGELKRLLRYDLPVVLGHDVAGVVREVGADVTGYAVGDAVFARPRDLRIGTFAELVAVDQADLAHKPASLSFPEAAAVPLVALAAWQALVEVARVEPGQKVLVHGGAGGLGSTVVQLAAHLGAHVATTASARDHDRLRALGADEVVDYARQDFTEVLDGYDVVVDPIGGDVLDRSLTVLAPGGIAISVVGPPDPAFAAQLGAPLLRPVMWGLSRRVRRRARRLGVRYRFLFMRADGAALTRLAALYDAGTLRPVLDRTFAFDRTPAALAHLEAGRARGKVVVLGPSYAHGPGEGPTDDHRAPEE